MSGEQEQLAPSTRVIYAVFDFVGAHWRGLCAGAAAALIVFLPLSGFYIVKKEELAAETRFGRLTATDIAPGLHYRWPIIERKYVRQVERIERQRISSRGAEDGSGAFTILSGDTNLLEMDLIVQYRIGDLKQYLFASGNPHKIVDMVVRESLVDSFGQQFIDLIFTQNRHYIEELVLENAVARLVDYDIGVEIVEINLIDIAPAEEAMPAFRDVSDSIAERLQMISAAQRESERLLAVSRGQAEAVRQHAQALALERVAQSESAATAYLALLGSYRAEPLSVAWTRYWQRMRSIFSDATLQAVNSGEDSRIDINMIEGGIGRGPAALVAATASTAPAAGLASERPLFVTGEPNAAGHAIENASGDDGLGFDGRFHARANERDHLNSAEFRSLIFDDVNLFRHRHLEPSTTQATQVESTEAIVLEQPLNEVYVDNLSPELVPAEQTEQDQE